MKVRTYIIHYTSTQIRYTPHNTANPMNSSHFLVHLGPISSSLASGTLNPSKPQFLVFLCQVRSPARALHHLCGWAQTAGVITYPQHSKHCFFNLGEGWNQKHFSTNIPYSFFRQGIRLWKHMVNYGQFEFFGKALPE